MKIRLLRLFALTMLLLQAGFLTIRAQDTNEAEAPPQRNTVQHLGEVVKFGSDLLVDTHQSCDQAVAIAGNATINGLVKGDAVVIGGTLRITGTVNGQAVVVGGQLIVGPDAHIRNGIVAIGASSNVDQRASVQNQRVEMGGFLGGVFSAAKEWLFLCLFRGRFIAPELPWTIIIFVGGLLLGLLLSSLFGTVYADSMEQIRLRPGAIVLAGLLLTVAVPIASFVLTITVIGLPVIPFLHLFLFGLGLIGTYALLTVVGNQLFSGIPKTRSISPLALGLIGSGLYTVLAMIPIIGMLVVIMVNFVGSGAGAYAFILMVKRSSTPRPINQPSPDVNKSTVIRESTQETKGDTAAQEIRTEPVELERDATFWERVGAGFIDIILVSIVYGIIVEPITSIIPLVSRASENSLYIPVVLAYFIVMWAWKGTTLGNVIFHLRVQQTNGERLSGGIAVIRGLCVVLSFIPLGIGFLWMLWDPNHQTWHDKIAGTQVRRVPSNINLLR